MELLDICIWKLDEIVSFLFQFAEHFNLGSHKNFNLLEMKGYLEIVTYFLNDLTLILEGDLNRPGSDTA